MGVRYVILNKEIVRSYNLKVDYGALVTGGSGQEAVLSGSPADKAGLRANDILLEINGTRIDENHPLASIINGYQPGDEVEIKYLRDNKESMTKLKLGSTE